MLQQSLPSAHVIYSSATGASNPKNLGYMIRMGTYGFKNMAELCTKLDKYVKRENGWVGWGGGWGWGVMVVGVLLRNEPIRI